MNERELLTKFLDYIYYISDKPTQYVAIGSFLEEGKEEVSVITAAVEAEREACAQIVARWDSPHPDEIFRISKLVEEIRARSNASSTPQAD